MTHIFSLDDASSQCLRGYGGLKDLTTLVGMEEADLVVIGAG